MNLVKMNWTGILIGISLILCGIAGISWGQQSQVDFSQVRWFYLCVYCF